MPLWMWTLIHHSHEIIFICFCGQSQITSFLSVDDLKRLLGLKIISAKNLHFS
jgi:hypothetical protein